MQGLEKHCLLFGAHYRRGSRKSYRVLHDMQLPNTHAHTHRHNCTQHAVRRAHILRIRRLCPELLAKALHIYAVKYCEFLKCALHNAEKEVERQQTGIAICVSNVQADKESSAVAKFSN